MNRPTEADIEAAKAYLRLRLEAEHSMTYNLEIVMREAAGKIVNICYSEKTDPTVVSFEKMPLAVRQQIEAVVQWLKETIIDVFETLAVADHEDNKDLILAFVRKESFGMTFDERLSDYCTKYRDELLLLVGAGLFLGIGKTALAKSIGSHLKQPYNNPDLVDGIAAPLTYGRGKTNSMFTAISGLTTFGIAQAWMRDWELSSIANSVIGWEVRRGSSYPCGQCDDNCGFHSIDEGTDLPQHLSCCCFAVPIYVKE